MKDTDTDATLHCIMTRTPPSYMQRENGAGRL